MREANSQDLEFAEAHSATRAGSRATGDLLAIASCNSCATSSNASRPPFPGELDVTRLASTVVRVRELRNRFTDIETMRRRLESLRDRASIQAALAERDVDTASRVGRDFCAARGRHEVENLREEAADSEALLEELHLVARSLESERSELAAELMACASVAEALPTARDRKRARQLLEDALWRLGVSRKPDRQTFTRGDTKQYGHAR